MSVALVTFHRCRRSLELKGSDHSRQLVAKKQWIQQCWHLFQLEDKEKDKEDVEDDEEDEEDEEEDEEDDEEEDEELEEMIKVSIVQAGKEGDVRSSR